MLPGEKHRHARLRRGGARCPHEFSCVGPRSAPHGAKGQRQTAPGPTLPPRGAPGCQTQDTGRRLLPYKLRRPRKMRWITHGILGGLQFPHPPSTSGPLQVTPSPGYRSLHCGILARGLSDACVAGPHTNLWWLATGGGGLTP